MWSHKQLFSTSSATRRSETTPLERLREEAGLVRFHARLCAPEPEKIYQLVELPLAGLGARPTRGRRFDSHLALRRISLPSAAPSRCCAEPRGWGAPLR